jgi:hypothetical protein
MQDLALTLEDIDGEILTEVRMRNMAGEMYTCTRTLQSSNKTYSMQLQPIFV